MYKIAIISAADLPIPAVKGGATETLTTHLLKENSKRKKLEIDVYSKYDDVAQRRSSEYSNTHFNFYNPSVLKKLGDKLQLLITRCFRKLTHGKVIQRYGFVDYCIRNIQNKEYDLVLLEGNTMYVRQLRDRINNKILLHLHTDILNGERPIDRKMIGNSLDGLIVVSDYAKSRALMLDSIKDTSIYVLKNIIDTALFRIYAESENYRNSFREEHHISCDDKVLVYCGRIVEQKGVLEIIHALKQLDESYKLLVIGSHWFGTNKKTKYIAEVESACADIAHRVFFTGFIPQDKLPKYYAIGDIAIFPSRYNETAGLVVLEALACGLPVIVPDFAGMAEYAPDACSVKIDTRHHCAENIYRAINTVFTEKNLLDEMKKNAVAYMAGLCVEDYYNNFLEIITDAAEKEL